MRAPVWPLHVQRVLGIIFCNVASLSVCGEQFAVLAKARWRRISWKPFCPHSIWWNLFQVPEVFFGDKRWPAGILSLILFGDFIMIALRKLRKFPLHLVSRSSLKCPSIFANYSHIISLKPTPFNMAILLLCPYPHYIFKIHAVSPLREISGSPLVPPLILKSRVLLCNMAITYLIFNIHIKENTYNIYISGLSHSEWFFSSSIYFLQISCDSW